MRRSSRESRYAPAELSPFDAGANHIHAHGDNLGDVQDNRRHECAVLVEIVVGDSDAATPRFTVSNCSPQSAIGLISHD